MILATSCADDEDDAEESPTIGVGGTVSVVVSDLEGQEGDQLAGVLRRGREGVAGFATTVDADPFSSELLLGDVADARGEPDEAGLWPWATGVVGIPAGEDTMRVALGRDFCCYSRWMPAATPDLHL